MATLAAKAGRQPVDFIDRFQGSAIKSHTFTIYPGQESSQEGRPGLKKCTRIGRKGMPRGRGWVLRGGCGDRVWEMTIELLGWNIEDYTGFTSPGRGNGR